MDGLEWKPLLKWMIWGYPYFRRHPLIGIIIHLLPIVAKYHQEIPVGIHSMDNL